MVYGTGKVVEKGLTTLDKDNKVGTAIAKFDQKIKDKTGLGIPKFSDNERNVALSYVRVQ
jgi:hypothetical protein